MSTATFKDYFELCKPRVVLLMIITAAVAMLLATPADQPLPVYALIVANIGIALVAFAGGVVNHLVDRSIDAVMRRTQKRPIATGKIKPSHATALALILTLAGMTILMLFVNVLTAWLSFATLIGYAIVYTLYLKRATPQNIVIGGLAGAMPPLLGWMAVTNQWDAGALLLVAIIFTWTPPHFWALSIYRYDDYKNAKVPMLPIIHGIKFTKQAIALYTVLMIVITYLPYAIAFSGLIYLLGVTILNAIFAYYVYKMYRSDEPRDALRVFHYSITYLGLLFVLFLVDHYLLLTF